jgi:hypothetical protein
MNLESCQQAVYYHCVNLMSCHETGETAGINMQGPSSAGFDDVTEVFEERGGCWHGKL